MAAQPEEKNATAAYQKSTEETVVVETEDVREVSNEEAASELKSITLEAARNPENEDVIREVLRRSYEIRQKEEMSELLPFFVMQIYLEAEVELRLESSMAEMEQKIHAVLANMSSKYSIPGTILELEKLMQPKRATWNAITMDDYTEQKRPGPSIFFGNHQRNIIVGDQIVCLNDECTIERATILLLGVYYILNLNFPAAYVQFLGLLQNIIVKGKKFTKQFSSNHLLQVTNNLL